LVVLHLRNSDRLGGPERLILDQAARAGAGVRPVVASFVRPGVENALLDEARRRGLETRPIAQRHSYDLRVIGRVREAIAAAGAHVLVGHDYKANFVLARAAKGSATPRVALVHGYTGENVKVRFFERLDRRRLAHAAAVVAVSASVRDVALAAGAPAERVHLVPNGIDVARVAAEAAAGRTARGPRPARHRRPRRRAGTTRTAGRPSGSA